MTRIDCAVLDAGTGLRNIAPTLSTNIDGYARYFTRRWRNQATLIAPFAAGSAYKQGTSTMTPYGAKHKCAHPMCNALVRTTYCDAHKPAPRPDDRPSASKRGYDRRHQRLRKVFLAKNPLCHDCEEQGRLTTATEMHHIVALRDGGTNHWDNLMALCKPCHDKRTRRGE
jgi:5-methylcytosine-specific restriction enzyme A